VSQFDAKAFAFPGRLDLPENVLEHRVEEVGAERVTLFGPALNAEFPAVDIGLNRGGLVIVEALQ
jgi:hypothetical protein